MGQIETGRKTLGWLKTIVLVAVSAFLCGKAIAINEPVQALTLPSQKVEVEPRPDFGPDAPPPFYPLEEINQSVFRGVRHGFVNTTVGNLAFGVLDLKLPGRMPIQFRRVYDSGITAYLPPAPPGQQNEPRWSFDLGPNWALGFAAYLIPVSNGVIQATPEGDVLWWISHTDGNFTRQYDAPTRHMKLQRQSSTVIVETQMDGTKWTYTWSVNAAGSGYLLTQISDRSGNTITVSYNQGYISRIQNSDGAYIDVSRPVFDPNYPPVNFPSSRVTKLTDSTGRTVLYDYDSSGRLIKATDVFGKDWTYGYDVSSNKLTSATNPLGDVYLSASYDSSMRISNYEANAGPWTFAYSQGGDTTVTDGLGNIWRYTPSSSGITTAVKEPTLGQHTLTLDAANNPTNYYGPSGEHATWTYDANHRPLTHAPAGTTSTITYVYDATNGWVNTITSLTGGVTTFVRDALGRVTEERDAYNDKTTATYGVTGDRLTLRMPKGNVTNPDGTYLWTFTYDGYGHPVTATDPTGRVFETDYTAQGDLWKLRRPDHLDPVTQQVVKAEWTYNRDLAGRVTTTVDPLGNTWTRTYDDAGRLVRVQGPAGTNHRYAYDARYRLTEIWNDAITPNVEMLSFTYDAAGRLATRTVAAGGTYTFAHDPSGRLSEVTDPLNRVWSYQRDDSGRVTQVTYPGGRSVAITRDAAGRITDRLYPGGRHETYTFDASGQLLTADATESPNSASLTWTRDLLERPATLETEVAYQSLGFGHTLTFAYDPDGNRLSLADPYGISYDYAYDELDRPIAVTQVGGLTWDVAYDPYSGNRTEVSVPATAGTNVETWAYDMAGRITAHAWDRPDASDSGSEAFTLDAEGRNLSAADAVAGTSQTMSYRADGLLAQLVATDDTATTTTTDFTYDDGGKLVYSSAVTGTDPAVATDLQYDVAGRLAFASQGPLSRTYTWSDAPSDTGNAFEVWRSPSDATENSLEIGYGYDGRLRAVNAANIENPGVVNSVASYLWSALDQDVRLAASETTPAGTTQMAWSMDVGGYFDQQIVPGSQGSGAQEDPVAEADGAARVLAPSAGGAMPDAEAPLRVGWSERTSRFAGALGLASDGTDLSVTHSAIERVMGVETDGRPYTTLQQFGTSIAPIPLDFVDNWANEGIARRQWTGKTTSFAAPGDPQSAKIAGAAAGPFTSDCHSGNCVQSADTVDGTPVCLATWILYIEAKPPGQTGTSSNCAEWDLFARPPGYWGAPPDACGYQFTVDRPYGQPQDQRGPDISQGGVSLSNGEFVTDETDLKAFDRFGTMSFTRTYRSKVFGGGVLGPGWRHNWEQSLDFGHDRKHGDATCGYVARWVQPSGDFMDFHFDDGATDATGPDDSYYRMRKYTDADGLHYELRASTGETYLFDAAGRLNSISRSGHTITLSRGSYGVTAISSPDAQRLTLSYYTTPGVANYGRLQSVTKAGSDGTDTVTYQYDNCGILASVTKESVTLGYDKNGTALSTPHPRVTTYVYESWPGCGSHDYSIPPLLTQIGESQFSPLDGAGATTDTLVINNYGHSVQGGADPNDGKVTGQCYGTSTCAAGGEDVQYSYTLNPYVWGSDISGSATITDTRVTPPVIDRHVLQGGRLTTLTEDVGGLNRVTQFTYNGTLLTKTTRADGTCHAKVYAQVANIWMVQQDIEKTALSCSQGSDAAHPDRITYYTYEPVSGNVRTVTRPEAFFLSAPYGTVPQGFNPETSEAAKPYTTFYYYDVNQTPANQAYPPLSGLQEYCDTWGACPAKDGIDNGSPDDNGAWEGNLIEKKQFVPGDGARPDSTLTWTYVSQEGGRPLKATGPDLVSTDYYYYTAASATGSEWDYRTNATVANGYTTPGPAAKVVSSPAPGSSLAPLTKSYAWSRRGDLVSTQDAAGVRTETTLDKDGQVLREVTCSPGSLAQACDPAQVAHHVLNQVLHTYDLRGREIQVRVHDAQRDLGSTTTPLAWSWTQYDVLGRPTISVTDPSPNASYPGTTTDANHVQAVTQTCLDGLGQMKRLISPEGRVSCTTYDALGRATSVKRYDSFNAGGSSCQATENTCPVGDPSKDIEVQTQYDAMDRVYAARDANGHWTYQWYDAFGEPEFSSDGKPTGASDPVLLGGATPTGAAANWYTRSTYTWLGLVVKKTAFGRSATLSATCPGGTCSTNTDSGTLSTQWFEYDTLRRPRKSYVAITSGRYVDSALASWQTGHDGTPPSGTTIALTQKTYGMDGKMASVIDAAGREVSLTYDKFGRRDTTLLPSIGGHQDGVQNTYDAYGRPYRTTTTNYDPNGNPHAAVVENTTLDPWSRVIVQTGAPGDQDLITTFEYDGMSRKTRTARRWQVATSYSSYDPNDRVTWTEYDGAGRVLKSGVAKQAVPGNPPDQDAAFAWTNYAYDKDGLLLSIEDANNDATTWDYTNLPDSGGVSALGRLRKMKYADNTQGVVVTGYDANGNATQVQFRKDVGTPASAVIWNQTFDEFDRMTHREAAFDTVSGDPTFAGATTQPAPSQDFTFDDAGRLVVALDRSPEFVGDEDIWVQSQFDTAGRRIQELQRMPINGGAYKDRIVSSTYGADGFRAGLTYPTSYSGGSALAPYALTMQPDALGRLSTIAGPQDSLEPPIGQGSRATAMLATYTWMGARVWDRLSGNGLDQRYADETGASLYDSLGRVRGVRSVDSQNPGFVVTDFRYGYDRAGDRTYEQRRHEPLDDAGGTFRTRTYKTDLMGRLAGWKEKALGPDSPTAPIIAVDDTDPTDGLPAPSDGEDWSLDLLGNWTSQTIGVASPVTKSFTPNSFNQYASIDPDGSGGPQPPVTLDHDWLGQLWKDRDADRTYQWDAFGRMARVYQGVTNPALIATYRYDAMNRRVEKTVSQNYATGDLVTRFIYDGWRAIEERGIIGTSPNQDEAVRARYGFGVGLDELIWMDRDLSASGPVPNGDIESRFYASQDALGSVTAATRDRQGTGTLQVAEHYTYSAYGQVKVWTGTWLWQSGTYSGGYQNESTIGLPYLYTGQRQDYETRLYYEKNRYLDPVRGRFLSRDPSGLQAGPNLFAYVNSMPASLIDPMGLQQQVSGMPTDRASGQAWLQRKWKESTARGDVGQANNPNDNRCGSVGVEFNNCQEKLDHARKVAEEQGKKPKPGEAGSLSEDDEKEAEKNHVINRVTIYYTITYKLSSKALEKDGWKPVEKSGGLAYEKDGEVIGLMGTITGIEEFDLPGDSDFNSNGGDGREPFSAGGWPRSPGSGEPNTTVRFPGKTPGKWTDRTYGPDGRAVKDVDYGHDHTGVGDPHAHDWDWSKPRGENRGDPRSLEPGEVEGAEMVAAGAGLTLFGVSVYEILEVAGVIAVLP